MKLLGGKSNEAWRKQEFCVIDVETTGLDLINDEVISIGAVKIYDGRYKAEGNFYEEIAPTKSPSAKSIAIHGLRSADLKSAYSLDVVAPSLIACLGRESVSRCFAKTPWI
jgi:DNA polymerase III epsilon subunit-like protein